MPLALYPPRLLPTKSLGTRLRWHAGKAFTWFSTLQSGWVRSPGHVSTHCTHLCPWNQPWTAAVGYVDSFFCTLEVINGPSAWRNGLHTAS